MTTKLYHPYPFHKNTYLCPVLLITLSTCFSFQKLFNPKLKIVTTKSIRLKSQWYQIEFHVPQTINQAKRGGLDELWQGTNGFGRASWKCLSTSEYFKYLHENINQPTLVWGVTFLLKSNKYLVQRSRVENQFVETVYKLFLSTKFNLLVFVFVYVRVFVLVFLLSSSLCSKRSLLVLRHL